MTVDRELDNPMAVANYVLTNGADLLVEKDRILLHNFVRNSWKRDFDSSSSKLSAALRRYIFNLNTSCFSLVWLTIIAGVWLAFDISYLSASVVLMSTAATFVLTRRLKNRKVVNVQTSVADLIQLLRDYIRTSEKALALAEESDDTLLTADDENASFSNFMATKTAENIHLLACSSRSLVKASRKLTDLEIIRDCQAMHEFQLQNDGHSLPCRFRLRSLHAKLLVYSSENLKLLGLAHSLIDGDGYHESMKFIAASESLRDGISESLASLRSNYYLSLYAWNADTGAHDRTTRRARELCKVHMQLGRCSREASQHVRSALLECSRLDTSHDERNVEKTLCRVASSLELALNCAKTAYCSLKSSENSQLHSLCGEEVVFHCRNRRSLRVS